MLLGDLEISNFSYKQIYPHIFVYKNLFPDNKRLYSILKESSINGDGESFLSKWTDWFVFGSYAYEKGFDALSLIEKHNEQKLNQFGIDLLKEFCKEELYLITRVKGRISQALMHYIGANSVILPENSYIAKPNYAKYKPEVVIGYLNSNELTMNYHTDYGIGEWFWENENFLITSTTYMNDDYDGGEITFFINGDIVTYKPEAGDILVFPSGSPLYAPDKNPYFHGVKKVVGNEKYLIRSYIKYPQKRK